MTEDNDLFFEHPILNSPYEYPARYWELDAEGQPTGRIIESRRRAEFITPIPKPRKRKDAAQQDIIFDEGKGLSTQAQRYDPKSTINDLRRQVDQWRQIPNPSGRLRNSWKWNPTPVSGGIWVRSASMFALKLVALSGGSCPACWVSSKVQGTVFFFLCSTKVPSAARGRI